MATDYDAPRGAVVEVDEDSLEELKDRRGDARAAAVDVDETAEVLDLPGADVLDEELTVAVVPIKADEFRCDSCFLVHHRSQLVSERGDKLICRECA
jgi:hypothetical protein